MSKLFELTNSTYSGYQLFVARIEYLSKIGYSNKLKEYYFDIGYDSHEFSKFTLSFTTEEEAKIKRDEIIALVKG